MHPHAVRREDMGVPIDSVIARRQRMADTAKIGSELGRMHWMKLLVVRSQVNARRTADRFVHNPTLGKSAFAWLELCPDNY